MSCFRSFSLLFSALFLALPHRAPAAPLIPGPNVSYNLIYTGAGTDLTAYGTGAITISYMDEGGQTVSGSLTAFNLTLTFTQASAPFAKSTFSYGLGDLSSDVILANGTASAPNIKYLLLGSNDGPAQFDLAYPANSVSSTYPNPYTTSGSVSLAPEPPTFDLSVCTGLLLVISGLVRRRRAGSSPKKPRAWERSNGGRPLAPLPLMCVLALALAIPLRADVVFGNLTGSFPPGTPVEGSNYGPTQSLAAAFTPVSDYSITDATARLDYVGIGGRVDFSIYSNDPVNNVPLTELDNISFANVPAEGDFTVPNLGNSLILLAGEEYWLVLSPEIPRTLVGWEFVGSSLTPSATDDLNAGWKNTGLNSFQFEIDGTPASVAAPEPASALLLIGALGMFGLTRLWPRRSTKRARPWSPELLLRFSIVLALPALGMAQQVSILAGSNQTMGTGRTFPARFQISITNSDGSSGSGQSVTFTAPSSGASGTFTGGSTSATVTTDNNGVATAPAFIANSTNGSYHVAATTASVQGLRFSLTNNACRSNPVVTSSDDIATEPGTLRESIQDACPNSEISFSSTVTRIQLSSRLRIDDNLALSGNHAIIDGGGATRLFFIGGGSVLLDGLTLQNGLAKGGQSGAGGGGAGMGGAMFINGGSVTLELVSFSGNMAQGGATGGNSNQRGGGGFGGDAPSSGAGANGGDLFGSGGVSSDSNAGGNGGDGAGGGSGTPQAGGQGGFAGGGGSGDSGAVGGFGGGGGALAICCGPGGRGGFAAGAGGVYGDNGSGFFGGGGAGLGGAIFVRAGSLALEECQFNNNSAVAGTSAGQSGQGKGGAIFIVAGAQVTDATSSFPPSSFNNNTALQAGAPSSSPYGIAPYASNTTCPGQDTADICGILAEGEATILAGSNQTIGTGRTFPARFQLSLIIPVRSDPIIGESVTFSAPASGASGTFIGGSTSATVTTDGNGVATSPPFIANGTPGSYTVTASVPAGSLAFEVKNNACLSNPSVTSSGTTATTPGTLPEVIQDACPGATITFSLGTGTTSIRLLSRLRVDDSLTIQGPGAANLAIGATNSRLFFIGGGNVAISGLTLQGGVAKGGDSGEGGGGAGMGGAMFINGGTVTANGLVFSKNIAQGGAADGNSSIGGGGGFGGDASSFGAGAPGGDLFGSGGHSTSASFSSGGNGGDGAGGGAGGSSGGNGGFAAGGGYGASGSGGFGGGSSASDSPAPGGFAAGQGGFYTVNQPSYGGGGAGLGGAIFLRAGSLALYDCQFENNSAIGGTSAAQNGQGKGGALFVFNDLTPGVTTATAYDLGGNSFGGDIAVQAGTSSPVAYGYGNPSDQFNCPGRDTVDVCGILQQSLQNVTNSVAVTYTGAVYNRSTRLYTITFTLKNISGQSIAGPVNLLLSGLPAGVTPSGNTGTFQGNPAWNAGVQSLAPGASVTVQARFSDPSNAVITFGSLVYSGAL